jgi:hypothetical protein
MTSSTFPPLRLPAALSRVLGGSAPTSPRHLAPDDGIVRIVEAGPDLNRTGRHAESEWSRLTFDQKRDDDAFEWLGFSADSR